MRLAILVLICAFSFGCRDATEPEIGQASAAKLQAAVKLTVLVVDDPEIAKGIGLLAGEWSERSGGEYTVAEMSLAEMLAAENLAADVIVYPSRHLGTLAMRNWLRPVRQSVLDDVELAWGDFLATVRDQSLRYGDQVMALPLGESPLVFAWQGTVPEPLPSTWDKLGAHGVRGNKVELGEFPLASEFLARVLAMTSPPERSTLLFDAQTFEAKLSQPQLIKAAEAMTRQVSGPELPYSAVVALPRKAALRRLSPLPASKEVFTASLDRWEANEESPPPVIFGLAGRLVSVTTASRNAASAFKLLPWVVSGTNGAQLSQRSEATLWFRASQVSQASKWIDTDVNDDRVSWITRALSRGEAYLLPRVPGIDEYLTELEAALGKAVLGEQSASEALAEAATRWNEITAKLGRDSQRAAFNRHLGLVE